jgi:adenosylmethionine-8-amino-7-oxononanoate aminotransferase
VLEPIIQGASGMKIYSADFLRRLRHWTQKHHIHLIADEIMTGIGRTGKMFACNHAQVVPDFICLSKGLTSGWLPLSVVLTHDDIYQRFYTDQYNHAFLHSHTYSGNALAVSVALETLNIIEKEQLHKRAESMGQKMLSSMQKIANSTQALENVRGVGGVVAADIKSAWIKEHTMDHVCEYAIKQGVLLRPLGRSIYWLPPLNITDNELDIIIQVTQQAILAVLN